MIDLALAAVVGAVSGLLAAFALQRFVLAADYFRLRREVSDLHGLLDDWLSQKAAADKKTRQQEQAGLMRERHAEIREDEENALAEAAALLQAGKPPEEILKTIAAKYPGLAARLAKKVMAG